MSGPPGWQNLRFGAMAENLAGKVVLPCWKLCCARAGLARLCFFAGSCAEHVLEQTITKLVNACCPTRLCNHQAEL